MSFTNHSLHSMYIQPSHTLTPSRIKHYIVFLETHIPLAPHLPLAPRWVKFMTRLKCKQYAHGLAWYYMYGAFVTT